MTSTFLQASYLVGVADPTSTAAVPGLVDQGQLARMAHMISSTCQTFTNPASTQTEVLWHNLATFPVHSQIVSHSHGDKIDLFVTFSVTRVEHICCSQVIAASGTVSKLSTTVCGICKVATTNTGNALVSKEFRRFMTRMTDSTATLLECTEVSGYKYIEHLIQ